MNLKKQVLWVMAAVVLTYLPFVNQPFHLDDYLYIDVARNVFHNPWFPQKMPMVFEGRAYTDMGSHSHPPFTSYFIAGLMALFNQRAHLSERAFHLGFMIFPLMLSLATLFLARRFTTAPVLTALWVMATPVVMVNSHVLMSDVPTLTFWVVGVTAFIYAVDTGRTGLFALSAVATCLAVYTSYQALSMVGLFWLYAALHKKWDRRVGLVSLAPVLLVVTWTAIGSWYYGRFLFAHTVQFAAEREAWSSRILIEKLISVWADLGGAAVFPLAILALLAGWLRGRMVLLMGVVALATTAWTVPDYPWWEKIILAVCLAAGLLLFVRILARGWSCFKEWRRAAAESGPAPAATRDGIFLAVWVLGVFVYCVGLFFTFTARYMLPMAPPAIVLLVNEVRTRFPHARRALVAGLLATWAMALLCSAADYQFAAIYPKIAAHLRNTYGKAGWKIWYAGEWGFRYYCQEAGAEILVTDTSVPRGGDLVIVPTLASGYAAAQDIETMLIPIEHRAYQPKLPLRLLDRFAHAGFHATYRGLLPFSFSRRPLEEITIKQVSLLIDQLPEAHVTGDAGEHSVMPTIWTLGGESKLTLQQMPNSAVNYAIRIPAGAQLVYNLGVMSDGQTPDTLTFGLSIKSRTSGDRKVFIRAVSSPGAQWIPESVDLSAFADQRVDLTLRITASKVPAPHSQRGGWGDFVIIPLMLK